MEENKVETQAGVGGSILKPGQDPRTVDLEPKIRAEKCWEAVKIVCQQFDCELEGIAIIKNGVVQTAIACNPVKRLTEEQEIALAAARAANGSPSPEAPPEEKEGE